MDFDTQYREGQYNGGGISNKNIIKNLMDNSFKFIKNDGQLDNKVKYYAKRGLASFFFTKDKIVFSYLRKKESSQEHEPVVFNKSSRISSLKGRACERLVFSLDFKGCSPNVSIHGLDECEDTVSYFKGNDPKKWCTKIPCYKQIIYSNLYPSIDLVCRFKDGALKYDFIINPGASLRDISLAYCGIGGLNIDAKGNLVIETPMGNFFDGSLKGYQEISGKKADIGAKFHLRKKTDSEYEYGFKIQKRCNPNFPIVIDPEIIYSSYLGGSGEDNGYGISVDQSGCAYITGDTGSLDFPVRNGYEPSYSFGVDAFVTKISPIPSIIYSTYLGGSGLDIGNSIAVDKMGNAYITGETESDDFPVVNAFDDTLGGEVDAFVTKLNPCGAIVYSSYLGGSAVDRGFGIAADDKGNAYITGDTASTNFPLKNEFDNTFAGSTDAFVTKVGPTGTLEYSSYFGGNNEDTAFSIAVDKGGNVYITGITSSTNISTDNGFQKNLSGLSDAFIAKISPLPDLVYSSYLGGDEEDLGIGVAVDENGNAYITGQTNSTNFPAVNAFQRNIGGLVDAFITKVSPVPEIVYSSYLGGSSIEVGSGVAVDENGNAYITGNTTSSDFPTVDAFDNCFNGVNDAFITKISPAPFIIYSSYLGGSGNDGGTSVAVDRKGNAYITGFTESTDFPVKNAFDGRLGGTSDAFVTKIEAVGQRPECILTHKVFDSIKQRKFFTVLMPPPTISFNKYTMADITFKNGIIDEKTLTITPLTTNPDYKCVRFMFKVPCISRFKDYRTGKVIEKPGCLSDIWTEVVLYMPKGRDELKFNTIVETATKPIGKAKRTLKGYKVKIGLFYVVKSVAKVQLEVIANGYCIPSDSCCTAKKDKIYGSPGPA